VGFEPLPVLNHGCSLVERETRKEKWNHGCSLVERERIGGRSGFTVSLQQPPASPSATSTRGRARNTRGSLPRVQEELPGKRLTGKSSPPSAKIRTLGEDFPECHGSTRGRFNAVDGIFFEPLPRVQHSGKKFVFFNSSPSASCLGSVFFLIFPSPSARCLGTRGRPVAFFLISSSPSARCPGTRGRPLPFFFFFSFALPCDK
jgi:hypothetical protein